MKTFRTNGAVGALLDEYEKAVRELQEVIHEISQEVLTTVIDPNTPDPHCRSIQTVLAHVVSAGRNYAVYIRRRQGEPLDFTTPILLDTASDYLEALDTMFAFNEQLFADYPDLELETNEADQKMLVRWGQLYDVEQLMEHAIVHILRHRRQIERFLLKLR
jgi:uncharacterized damage-inducible protein DinB